jgi:hypothetical protein
MTPLTPYQLALAKNMAEALQRARNSGATMMTWRNLMKITRMPSNFLEGSPKGWNAFNQCVDELMASLDYPTSDPNIKILADQFA